MESVAELRNDKPGYLLTLSWYPASGVGGVNQAVMNLARVMTERDEWRPYLLVTSKVEIPANHPHLVCPVESEYLRAPDLPVARGVRSLLGFLAHLPSSLLMLNRMLRVKNVKVVACHFPETESAHFVLLRLLRLYAGKVILSFHGEDIRVLARKRGVGRWIAKWMMRRADGVLACSRGLMQDLTAFAPGCEKHATVIYNAIDVDSFLGSIDRGFALPGSLKGKRFLLNVARYEHKKGHDVLVAAFERMAIEFPDLLLVTIGTSIGEEGDGVRAMIEKSTVRERILMLENIPHEQVGVYLQAATVFVLPSRREGFPFVLLEAGAAQKPVVAAACLGVPEIIEDGVTGLLAPVEDAESLARSVATLLRDQGERERLAEGLHRVVTEKFSWKTVYEEHMRLAGVGCD